MTARIEKKLPSPVADPDTGAYLIDADPAAVWRVVCEGLPDKKLATSWADYRWYDARLIRRFTLSRFSFIGKSWHPRARRLARLRALYWTLIRGHETEICARHGGPVRVVFWVPDELWTRHSGFERAERSAGGEAGAGVLCVQCFDDLYRADGGFLQWTCAAWSATSRQ